MTQERQIPLEKFEKLDLDGNHMVLDFLNTVDWRGTAREYRWLTDYYDVLAWVIRAGLASADEAEVRADIALTVPEEAGAAFSSVVQTQELLHRILDAQVGTGTASSEDWKQFNELLRSVQAVCSLLPADDGSCCRWEFESAPEDLLWFLAPLLKYAEELLVTPNDGRIKRCATEDCGWYFFDTSKNNGRRWCSPSCGNRTKVKRHYYKTRQT